MVNAFFTILFAAALSLLVASQFEKRGYFGVDTVCANIYGACGHPMWLAVGAAILFVTVIVTWRKS
jgi:hypothetical protein